MRSEAARRQESDRRSDRDPQERGPEGDLQGLEHLAEDEDEVADGLHEDLVGLRLGDHRRPGVVVLDGRRLARLDMRQEGQVRAVEPGDPRDGRLLGDDHGERRRDVPIDPSGDLRVPFQPDHVRDVLAEEDDHPVHLGVPRREAQQDGCHDGEGDRAGPERLPQLPLLRRPPEGRAERSRVGHEAAS